MSGGYRTPAERRAFQDLRGRGWESQGRNGTNHLVLTHPGGGRLTLPSASTDDVYRRLVRSAARLEAGMPSHRPNTRSIRISEK